MTWTTVLAGFSIAAVGLGAIYISIVPDPIVELGNLASVKSPEGKTLVAKHYPLFADSQFAQLSLGKTHYWIRGKQNGKKIVLVHGISGTWASMPQVNEYLIKKGYRVLMFDLFGRGYSDSPGAKYDDKTYTEQLRELLDHVGWDSPNVLGYSLGGGIAICFAAKYPERVDKLVLVAPSGLMKDIPFTGKVATIPVIGELITHSIGRKILANRSKSNYINGGFAHLPHMQHFSAVQMLNIQHNPGFIRAYMNTIKNGPIRGLEKTYAQVGKKFSGKRVFCIWGTLDTICRFDNESMLFRGFVPDAVFVKLDGAGHLVVAERYEDVFGPVCEYLEN